MSRRVYKYSPENVFKLMFDRPGFCGVKCSYPKDYNDPYELFLGADPNCTPDELAVYREIIQTLPQRPTTCFSNAPTVAPMWAHYAQNHSGFALEFDAKLIAEQFADATLKDVVYRDEPDPSIRMHVARAAGTNKARHAIWLRHAADYHAYFSKFPCWSYEEECRLVTSGKDVANISGHKILFIPIDCVTAIIAGMNASEVLIERSQKCAEGLNLPWLQEIIGKSSSRPFFIDADKKVWVHEQGKLSLADNVCGNCSEPIGEEEELCPWCQISGDDEYHAAMGNPLRMMHQYGLLDDYMRGVEEIEHDREP